MTLLLAGGACGGASGRSDGRPWDGPSDEGDADGSGGSGGDPSTDGGSGESGGSGGPGGSGGGDDGTSGGASGGSTGGAGSTDGGTGGGGSTIDEEGITKIYVDDPAWASQKFFLSIHGLDDDTRVDFRGDVEQVDDGVYEITPTTSTNPNSARVYIGTTNPDWSDRDLQVERGGDWRDLVANGYMIGPEDYKDTEVTAYYEIVESDGDDEMTFYWRGGGHPSGDEYPLQCIAVCMKAQIQMKDCSPRAAKEYDHYNSPDGYAWNDDVPPAFDLEGELGGSMVGKIIGQKLVIYNVTDNSGDVTAVRMELYVDTASADLAEPDLTIARWRLLAQYTDDGSNWPDPDHEGYIDGCHGDNGQLFTWGGPYIALRLDENVWRLFNLSIRPIVPAKAHG